MNNQELDALIDTIQSEVFSEAREALGEKGFDRWRNPKYNGLLKDADSFARLTGGCGDTMEMYIVVEEGCIHRASYVTDGCSSSAIAGSFAAELAMGKNFEEVLDMSGADVLAEIGTFPKAEDHCAHLAVRTLQEALNIFLVEEARKEKQKS